MPRQLPYAAAKGGLISLTTALSVDLARHGIRVNSLTPTATDTEEGAERAVAWGRPRPEARARGLDFARMVPMGRLPSPRHYARAVVFLAADEAGFCTGATFTINGGQFMAG